LLDLAANRVPPSRLFHYVRSKFSPEWFQRAPRPVNKESCARTVEKRSPFLINQAMNHRYPDRVDPGVRDRYLRELAAFIETAQRHGAAVYLMTQPTLLDPHEEAADFRQALENTIAPYGVAYTDHSKAIKDLRWFHDHDHLNDAGIRRYAQAFVQPLL
jgi:hypothetical protein